VKYFYYFPFVADKDADNQTSRQYLTRKASRRAEGGTVCNSEVTWIGNSPTLPQGKQPALAILTREQDKSQVVLVIDCHGSPSAFSKTPAAVNLQLSNHHALALTPDELARQLIMDGLPSDIKWIKLNACMTDTKQPGDQSLAEKLARALHNHAADLLVAGVAREIRVPPPPNNPFCCMHCGEELAQLSDGFSYVDKTPPLKKGDPPVSPIAEWLGPARNYYDVHGTQRTTDVAVLKLAKGSKKHICPKCGKPLYSRA
jgi:hypothetical protein